MIEPPPSGAVLTSRHVFVGRCRHGKIRAGRVDTGEDFKSHAADDVLEMLRAGRTVEWARGPIAFEACPPCDSEEER